MGSKAFAICDLRFGIGERKHLQLPISNLRFEEPAGHGTPIANRKSKIENGVAICNFRFAI